MNKKVFEPQNDGIDHIRVGANGKTKLGRLLAMCAATPFTIAAGTFKSLDAFRLWKATGLSVRAVNNLTYERIARELTCLPPKALKVMEPEVLRALRAKLDQTEFSECITLGEVLDQNQLAVVAYDVIEGEAIEEELPVCINDYLRSTRSAHFVRTRLPQKQPRKKTTARFAFPARVALA